MTTPPPATAGRCPPPRPALRRAIIVLALVAAGTSDFLLWATLTNANRPPGCGPGSGCDLVLNSRWATWLGVPVSLYAVLLYLGMVVAIGCATPTRSPRRQRLAWGALLILAATAASSAAWFIAVQAFVIGAACPYCMAVHALGLMLAGLIYWAAPIGKTNPPSNAPPRPVLIRPAHAVRLVLVGVAAPSAMALTQALQPPPPIHVQRMGPPSTPPTDALTSANRWVPILGNQKRINPYHHPTLGPPDAPRLVISLFDYTCPHCRVMHQTLRQARQRYDRQIAVVCLPMPLDSHCNRWITQTAPRHRDACEYAKLALAVWKAKPQSFTTFDDWLFKPDRPPGITAARQYAAQLVGHALLRRTLADPWINQEISHNVALHRLAQTPVLPVVVIGSAVVTGQSGTVEEFFNVIEDEFHLTPAGPTRPGNPRHTPGPTHRP